MSAKDRLDLASHILGFRMGLYLDIIDCSTHPFDIAN
jgi:hypothetical protein